MWLDIGALNDFYGSELGVFTQKVLVTLLKKLWPRLERQYLLGLGYPLPYFNALDHENVHCIAAMPAYQGVCPWPLDGNNKSVLLHEQNLPFRDHQFDKAFLMHNLGNIAYTREVLREVERVLRPQGEMILVVPHRFGFWSHSDKTPYGASMPYTVLQLKQMLIQTGFVFVEVHKALYAPPLQSPAFLWSLPSLEKIFHQWIRLCPGIIVMKVIKQVHAPLHPRILRSFVGALATP